MKPVVATSKEEALDYLEEKYERILEETRSLCDQVWEIYSKIISIANTRTEFEELLSKYPLVWKLHQRICSMGMY